MSIKIKKNFMAISLILTIVGGMSLTKALGVWTDADGLTQAVQSAKKEASKEVVSTVNGKDDEEKEVSINISVSEIKGSSSFGQVADVYLVNIDDLIKGFSLSNEINSDTKIKELATIFGNEDDKEGGIGTSSVRYFVAKYVGEEYISEEEVYLPKAAVELLDGLGKLDTETKEYLRSHTVVK